MQLAVMLKQIVGSLLHHAICLSLLPAPMAFNIEVIWKILVGFRNVTKSHFLSGVNFTGSTRYQVSNIGI